MAAEIPESTEDRPPGPGWRQWLQFVAAALALLAASEVLWLWQSWPVRELLQPAAAAAATPGTK